MTDQEFFRYLEDKCNIKLTREQMKAVVTVEGTVGLASVPGSGKTSSVCCRIAYMILVKGIEPRKIMTVTYSRASANDMKERFIQKFGEVIPEKVYFATIHSFAYSVIKNYEKSSGIRFILIEGMGSPITKNTILRNLYSKYNNEPLNEDKLEELSGYIGFITNRMISDVALEKLSKEFPVPNFINIYLEYRSILEENNYMDFDRMLKLCHDILSNNRQILGFYKEYYDYYMLDEGQDTSQLQHHILKLLTAPIFNICVVFDDDQSIYSWRGAEPKLVINLNEFYSKDAVMLSMERNFRSSQKIIRVANEFIKENKTRISKNLYTENEEGINLQFVTTSDEFKQIEYVLNDLSNSDNLKETAVLFRNNLTCISIVDTLIKQNIPFYIKDGVPSFFNHWITRDILSFFSLASNPKDVLAFKNIYYKFKSFIKKIDVEQVLKSEEELMENDICIFDFLASNSSNSEMQKNRLSSFKKKFERLTNENPKQAIVFIEEDLNYREYLKDYAEKFNYSMDNIDAFLSTLKILSLGLRGIDEFKDKLEFLQNKMSESKKLIGKNAVTLSTLHSSKGLEWDKVMLIGMNSSVFPSPDSVKKLKDGFPADYEEETRLCYVGITRARKDLRMICPLKINNQKSDPSSFYHKLLKIDRNLNYSPEDRPKEGIFNSLPSSSDFIKIIVGEGDFVDHDKFGKGSVVKVDGDIITVNFSGDKVKKLSLEVCSRTGVLKLVPIK